MGRYVFTNELSLHGLDGPADKTSGYAKAKALRTRTVDELLASCPTEAEVTSIGMDFPRLQVDQTIRDEPDEPTSDLDEPTGMPCTYGGSEYGSILAATNMFRVLRLITFDSPVPLFNDENLYNWLKRMNIPIYVFRGGGVGESGSYANSSGIHISHRFLRWPDRRVWVGDRGGLSTPTTALLHEAWHYVSGKRHDVSPGGRCGASGGSGSGCDSSLAYGGAHAASYRFNQWLAQHSRSYLTPEQRAYAQCVADGAARKCMISFPVRPGC